MQELYRVRRFLDLRQSDIARATGVPVYRISMAERQGISTLDATEQRLVSAYLSDRMRVIQELSMEVSSSQEVYV
jgi:hypothetical protein